MLWRALKHIEDGFYIDVGANDPVDDSMTKLFYDRGWKGINIEPSTEYFLRLKEGRNRDINLSCAAGEYDGIVTFFNVGTRGLSTTDRAVGEYYRTRNHVETRQVEVLRLDTILERYHPDNIHFLKIDVEGAEAEVINGLTLNRFRPWILVIEAVDPIEHQPIFAKWEPRVIAGSYRFVFFDGLNRYYVAEEHMHLEPAFSAPPNVFDNFVSYASAYWHERSNQLETRARDAAARCADADARCADAEHQLHLVLNSRSWRMTAPLRDINQFARKTYGATKHRLIMAALVFYRKTPIVKSLARHFFVKFPSFQSLLARVAISTPQIQANIQLQRKNVAKLRGQCGSTNYVQACWRRYHALDLRTYRAGSQPLLSLCISTYNRAHWLKHSLNNILPQVEEFTGLLELVICDNASTDDTEEVVREAGEHVSLRYYRNRENVGMLGNLRVTADHARGKFVWIIGDDDMLLKGTLEDILKAIISFPDLEFIYTNYSYTHVSDPLSVNYDELLRTQTPITPIMPNRYCAELRHVAGNTENFFTAIYCCIFRLDHARACYSQNTSGRPFSSLVSCVPTTNYVLNNLLNRPAFWYGDLAVLVNMNVSWLKYADLWVLERFPEIYERFQQKGVPATLIDSYRNKSIPGVVYHLKEYIARNSENLDIINLRCLFRTYRHLKEFQAVLPQIKACIGQNQEFKSRVAFAALQSEEKPPVVVDGPFVGSYSIAIVNRNISVALDHLGRSVSIGPSPTEGSPFIITRKAVEPATWNLYLNHENLRAKDHIALRYTYPPVIDNMKGVLNIYHSFGWEESEFPSEFVDLFNKNLDAITVMSDYVRRVLESNGVEIPIICTGLGADHHEMLDAQVDAATDNDKFTFLHISSCFPRKGVDVLLQAFMECFNASDDVRLVIKTFPNPHNDVEQQLTSMRKQFPQGPEIVVINEDWSDQDRLAELYAKCDVLVAPSRGEGFSLPIAEALWAGKSVIATGFGGHMDFLGEDYPWLIDYRFELSSSHLCVGNSYWVAPYLEDLIRLLKEAYATPLEKRRAIAMEWKDRLANKFTWKETGIRLLEAIDKVASLRSNAKWKKRSVGNIAVASTWNSRCGVAVYCRHLISVFPEQDLTILANVIPDKERTECDAANVKRCWMNGSISGMIAELVEGRYEVLIIQYQPSFFDMDQLIKLVSEANNRDIFSYLFVHNVHDLVNKCSEAASIVFTNPNVRIMVHTVNDLNLVKDRLPQLLRNTVHFPHGVVDARKITNHMVETASRDYFVVATFGFLLPHKGIAELIRAVAIALKRKPHIRLNLYTAQLDERSALYRDQCQQLIDAKGIGDKVKWHLDYLPIDDVFQYLAQADLLVLPYSNTTESSSAAARMCLSSGTPLICTRNAIFDDIARVVKFVDNNEPGILAEAILTMVDKATELDGQRKLQDEWIRLYNWQRMSNRLKSIIKQQQFSRLLS